ncbi:isocitrate lyase/PEP mutase family protein [Bradyrhizobium lablabi]|uniref:isocitrate lyase/PEP mutase family protein n=1 Tax=Bradyrhizobium lablabi TaxID=722472 RepID=UPI001BAA110F|nr:isocitrate lyase/PEP mutase family protein [Bradyrhizobium lablabi]MBR1122893.1 isocitrate lyase/PEP mutase family protein [Bradyrhizobium lablabi]
MTSTTLRTLIREKPFVTCPGVFDLVSAKLADRSKADALYMTGYGTVASFLGLPDAGLATYSQMLDRVQAIVQAVDKPLIADGDTGYGGLLNVHHTVRGYERAGAAAIQLEDQQSPKKCGHTPNRHVIPVKDMINKLTVANDARSSRDFLIIARTDARTALGLDEAIRRGEAYARAGADIIFIESPESEAEMRRIGSALDVPLVSNQLHGGRTPILSPDRLREIGYRMAIYPTAGLLASAHALNSIYGSLADGKPVQAPLYDFDQFSAFIGFKEVWDFEKKYAALEAESAAT